MLANYHASFEANLCCLGVSSSRAMLANYHILYAPPSNARHYDECRRVDARDRPKGAAILPHTRHDGCSGLASKAKLLTNPVSLEPADERCKYRPRDAKFFMSSGGQFCRVAQ
jgi:hypothetical protein